MEHGPSQSRRSTCAVARTTCAMAKIRRRSSHRERPFTAPCNLRFAVRLGVCTRQVAISDCTAGTRDPCLPTHVPCLPTHVPCLPTRDPCLPTRDPCLPTRDPCLPTRDPCPPTRDPCPPTRDPCPPTRDPCLPTRDPCLPTRVPYAAVAAGKRQPVLKPMQKRKPQPKSTWARRDELATRHRPSAMR
jgi:hypothetical protein